MKKAFTLVELLVVIAIIAVLVAILVPVINSALKDAQKSACQANLKVIGGAFREYARTPGGFPRQVGTGDPADAVGAVATMATLGTNPMDTVAWPMLVKGYLPVTAFHCPADAEWTERESALAYGWVSTDNFSYGVHFPFAGDGTTVAGDADPNDKDFPPNGILMADIGTRFTAPAVRVAVTTADDYTNHDDGLSCLTLAGNVSYHAPDTVGAANGSVINGDQIYDNTTGGVVAGGAASLVPTTADLSADGAILDVVILPLRAPVP